MIVFRDEFINAYLDERNRVYNQLEDHMRKIIDNDRQAKEVSSKLVQAQLEEVNFFDHNLGIRTDSKLKVHIVDAVNLPENATSFVKVIQDGASS